MTPLPHVDYMILRWPSLEHDGIRVPNEGPLSALLIP